MLSLFLKAFGLIFLAEMGDKTQISALALAASAKVPYGKLLVFLGSALALILTSAIAAIFGEALSRCINPKWVKMASGILFLVFGVLFLQEAFTMRTEPATETPPAAEAPGDPGQDSGTDAP